MLEENRTLIYLHENSENKTFISQMPARFVIGIISDQRD